MSATSPLATALATLALVGCPSAQAVPRPRELVGAEGHTQQESPAPEVPAQSPSRAEPPNVAGEPLRPCPSRHRTGFYRDGRCDTGPDDHGVHVVCATVTDAFLRFTASRGNDLSTPRDGFAGLREGDGWCLCAARWREALAAGVAPPVVLSATHRAALRTIPQEALVAHAREGAR